MSPCKRDTDGSSAYLLEPAEQVALYAGCAALPDRQALGTIKRQIEELRITAIGSNEVVERCCGGIALTAREHIVDGLRHIIQPLQVP